MNNRDISPSVWRYGLALLIVFVGFAVFAWYLFSGISSTIGGLTQVAAPGEAELNLSGPGEYTIFYENSSYFDGVLYETSEKMPGLQIEVVEKASGLKLQTYPSPSSSSYSVGGRSGHSVMAFRAEAAGLHVINASYPSEPGPKVVLAVGKGILEDMLGLIMISLALILGTLLIAAVITYTTYKGRKKAFEAKDKKEE